VLKAIVVKIRKQHAGIRVIQSLGVGITTTWVETVVAPSLNVVKREILIGFVAKLGSGLGGVLVVRNLSQSLALSIATIGVFGIPQMVFNNPIMTTHVNKIAYRPLMSSMVVGGCRSVDVVHSKWGYQEPITITPLIFYHKVDLKYLDFKKDAGLDAHVKVFNYVVKQM
jgi:hypothetical protein